MEPDITDRLRRTVNKRKIDDEHHRKEKHRARLTKVISKKTTTSFIGAIAQFESYFGVLWGHGKTEDKCTENELKWRDLWEKCRTEVLNNGNKQVRGIEAEMKEHDVVWNNTRILPVRG